MTQEQTNLIKWANKYVRLGWPVLPVHGIVNGRCTCGNSKCGSPGKHPLTAHGCKDATLDMQIIEGWFSKWTYANIAVATGGELWFLDVDGEEGKKSMQTLVDKYGELPLTPKQRTGKGYHLVFQYPIGRQIKNATGIREGIDVRAEGGYALVAPSKHESGKNYLWENDPSQILLAPPPDWLLELIETPVRIYVPQIVQANQEKEKNTGNQIITAGEVIPVGKRNDTLTRIAGSLYRKGATHEQVAEELMRVNCEQAEEPLPTKEVMAITESIGAREEQKREQLAKIRAKTDKGNAERLIDLYGKDLILKKPKDVWMVWRKGIWTPADDSDLVHMMGGVIDSIEKEADMVQDKYEKEALHKWAQTSQNGSRISHSLRWAKKDSTRWRWDNDFDAYYHLCNLVDGTYDLITKTFYPHRREDLLTQQFPCRYSQRGDRKLFNRVLEEIMDGDKEMISFLQRIAGYCLIGGNPQQMFFIFYGTGANGKSLILDLLLSVWGNDYAGMIPPGALVEQYIEPHPTELADFYKKRLMVADEVKKGKRLNEDRLKQLTGNKFLKARKMNQDFWQFQQTHKIIWAVNQKPGIISMDVGMWRRIIVMPFLTTIPPQKQDMFLLNKLIEQRSEIWHWALEGYIAWEERGLDPPQLSIEYTKQYRTEQDIFGQCIEECCIVGADPKIEANRIQNKIREWYIKEGLKPPSAPVIKQELESRGFREGATCGVKIYYGITIKENW